jgi:hypothetical protein
MKRLIGTLLVKKRAGGGKRVVVEAAWVEGDVRYVRLRSTARTNNRRYQARYWRLPVGEDGLPEGYRLAVKP